MAAEDGGSPIPELVQLGERLSSARRDQGLSLEDLAGRLRLGTEQLMALEAGDHTHLPEAVFVIAQAKRVAGALGIDVSQQIGDLRNSAMMRNGRSLATSPAQRRRPTPPATPARPGSGSPATASIPWLLLMVLGGGALAVAALQGKLPSLQAWRPPTLSPAPEPVRTAAPPAAPAAAPTAEPDQLLLRSTDPSWLEVRDAAGVTLFRGTLTGEQRFPLGKGLKVLAGRPDLVSAATGDGEARPLGRIDQVVWRTFKMMPGTP